jgi:Tfp pilus assembly protein PilF
VAELEFSFGQIGAAQEALNKSLALAPRNAQALALQGFLLAAGNRPRRALEWFDRAIAVDGALANAWLGRGLCRIRLGQHAAGAEDLLVAAALEPQRALLRSYLGKAFADAGDDLRAGKELELARKLDAQDPTGWLYSALLKQQENRINQAISDLEAAQTRNENRSLFRSRLLLDEDRAVESANLASIYRDAGMTDVSLREAAHAVTYDYANAAAHLFLSDSYNELRDPTRFNLRYETVWFNELLLANLLSPVGGGRLSQHVSQQEYSALFQQDGPGFANSTLGRSDNKSVTELFSAFGTFGWTSYSFDLDYQHNGGVRPNNDLDDVEWYTTIKQQLSAHDTVMALVKYEDYHSGDNFQYYDPSQARRHFRFDEYEQPIVIGMYHHEWAPGIHTLALGGRLDGEQHFSDLKARQLLLIQDFTGATYASDSEPFDINYHNQIEIYTAEINQIVQLNRLTLSVGARYQPGDIHTQVVFTNPPGLVPFLFNQPSDRTNVSAGFERFTGYGYATVEPLDRVWLIGGFAYDDLTYPRNFRYPPVSPGEDHRSSLGPKAAAVWQITPEATVRGIFTRSLGGVTLDESFRLEPAQLAGFPQAFRTLISESAAGSVEAPKYETWGGALDLKFPSRTYGGVQFEHLESNVRRSIGVYSLNDGLAPFVPASTREKLGYRENSVVASVNQLLGDYFTIGASYKFDQVELHDDLPQVPVAALASARQTLHADLHQTSGYILFNHPSGFFARADASWYRQSNSGYNPALRGDDFFQENLYAGWRFLQRRVELMLGILNLGDQDYRLNPLTVYAELPRERTYIARLNFLF